MAITLRERAEAKRLQFGDYHWGIIQKMLDEMQDELDAADKKLQEERGELDRLEAELAGDHHHDAQMAQIDAGLDEVEALLIKGANEALSALDAAPAPPVVAPAVIAEPATTGEALTAEISQDDMAQTIDDLCEEVAEVRLRMKHHMDLLDRLQSDVDALRLAMIESKDLISHRELFSRINRRTRNELLAVLCASVLWCATFTWYAAYH